MVRLMHGGGKAEGGENADGNVDGCNADGDDNDGKGHEKKYCMNDDKNDRSYLFIVSTQERGS